MTQPIPGLRPAPPFLLTFGLLLWGWQNDFLIFAVPMALMLETAHWVEWRWPISDKEFNNLADLSGVGFFIVVVYVFTDIGAKGIYTILALMPFVIFVLLTIQIYSESGALKLSALFVSLRKDDANLSAEANKEINISLPYFMICIISASAGNHRTVWFFVFCCVLIFIVLYANRSKRTSIILWCTLSTISIGLAYSGQLGIRQLQSYMEGNFIEVFDQFRWRYRDPNRASTAIGQIGRLKFSDKILVRIKTDEQLRKPLYLREASYNKYNYGSWNTSDTIFTTIDEAIGGDSWAINDLPTQSNADMSFYMLKEAGVVPLPQGVENIHGAGIVEIEQNSNGTINMEIREGWIQYKVDYNNDLLNEPAPGEDDLYVGSNYENIFNSIVTELGLKDISDEEKIDKVKRHFRDNFTYSLNDQRRYARGNYLQNFLENDRTGHCEYFATSTALLLRAAGIPTRYAVGYTTDEYSPLEGQYIARSRDAHSWVLAYVNNEWLRIDTTPSIWAEVDDNNASIFQGLGDMWAWISYRYDLLITEDELEAEESNLNLLWLLIPLVLILFWRLYFKERIQKNIKVNDLPKENLHGKDSEFYSIVSKLNEMGHYKYQGETLYKWLNRISKNVDISRILPALELHYRYRFDPDGIDADSRDDLDKMVSNSLSSLG